MIRKLLTLFCLLSCFGAAAADRYVRTAAQGNDDGSDWDNAWSLSSLNWAALNPGDTVWIAGGTYTTQVTPNKAGTAGNRIYFKRVLSSDAVPAGASGWDPSFDSMVIIAPPSSSVLDFTIAGGGDFTYWDGRTNYGMRFKLANYYGSHVGAVHVNGGGNNLVFTNVDILGPEHDLGPDNTSTGGWLNYPEGFHLENCSGITASHCRISHLANFHYMKNTTNNLFEYCDYFSLHDHPGYLPPPYDPHVNIVEAGESTSYGLGYNTWRYCHFSDWNNEGFVFGFPTLPYYIYGCVFDNSTNPAAQTAYGRVIETYPQSCPGFNCNLVPGELHFLNNTVIGAFWAFVLSATYGDQGFTNSEIKNNIYWDTGSVNAPSQYSSHNFSDETLTGPNSISGGSNPFVNYAAGNYRIVTNIAAEYPRNKGTNLAAIYNTDMDGNTRGDDGYWDIGAYEYGSASTNPPVILTGNLTGTNGIAFETAIQASGNPHTFAAINLPTGLTCNLTNGLISGVPSATETTNSIFYATNDFGFGVKTNLFTINDPVGILSVSPLTLFFGYIATNTSADLVLTLTNSGSSGTTVSGSFSNATSPFSIVGDADYSLITGQTDTITIRYSPTARGQHVGSVVWTGGGSVGLVGLAYPVASGSSWTMTHSLLVAPMISNANNYVSQQFDTATNIGVSGQASFGYRAASSGTIKLNASALWTGGSDNSFWVTVHPSQSVYSKNFVGSIHLTNNIWDIIEPPVAGFSRVYVHQRGINGTFELPEFPTNSFSVSAGINQIKVYGREANAQLRDMQIEFVPSGLFISPQNLRIGYGQTVQFYATNNYGSGVLSNVTDSATWASSIPGSVWINPTNGFAIVTNSGEWRVDISATWSNLTASTEVRTSNSAAYPPNFISISFLPDEHDYCTIAWTTVGQCTNILDLRICPTDEIVSFTNSVPSNSYENYLSQWYDVEDEIVWCDYRARIVGGNGLTTTSDWYRVCSGACVPGALAVGTNWLSVYERPKAFSGGMLIAN